MIYAAFFIKIHDKMKLRMKKKWNETFEESGKSVDEVGLN